MIVKTVYHRALVSPDDGDNAMAESLGDQVHWISGVEMAQIIEYSASVPIGDSFVKRNWFVGEIVSEQERDRKAAQANHLTLLPRTRWMIVWLTYPDGTIDQLCLGDGAECYLMNDDGKTVDKLM